MSFVQDIFTDYKQPFAVTYLGASLMVVYLPIAFIKDWFYNFLKHRSSKGGKSAESNDFSSGFSSPIKFNGGQSFEIENQGTLTRKDSDADLSPHGEGRPLVSRHKDDLIVLKHDKELSAKEIARYGFYIAPIWFITEVGNFQRLLCLLYLSILTIKPLGPVIVLVSIDICDGRENILYLHLYN